MKDVKTALLQFAKECVEFANAVDEMIKKQEDDYNKLAESLNAKPTVIIEQSGGTWAIKNYGIDYLFLGQDVTERHIVLEAFRDYNAEMNHLFKPISEIKITDEIAKLRPMVVGTADKEMLAILYGVHQTFSIVYHRNGDRTNFPGREYTDNLHIATVHDLKETK